LRAQAKQSIRPQEQDWIASSLRSSQCIGRRAATAEARITDAKGRLLAHATTTCLVFEIPKGT
jgi:acyl-coenzyme A thioesterase PaaI-like protein